MDILNKIEQLRWNFMSNNLGKEPNTMIVHFKIWFDLMKLQQYHQPTKHLIFNGIRVLRTQDVEEDFINITFIEY